MDLVVLPSNPLDVIPVPTSSVFCKACGTSHAFRGILCPAYRLDICGIHKTVLVPHEKSIYEGSPLQDVDTECHRCQYGTSEKKLNRALTRANSLVLRPSVTHKDVVFCVYCWAPATKDCAHLNSCREHSTLFLRSQVDINARWFLRPSDFTCFLCPPNGVMFRKAQEWKKKLATAAPPNYFSSEWNDWKEEIKGQIEKLQPGRFPSWQARTEYVAWMDALGPKEMLLVRYLAYEGEYPVTSIYAETGTVPLSLLPPTVVKPSLPPAMVELPPPPYNSAQDKASQATCPPMDQACQRAPHCAPAKRQEDPTDASTAMQLAMIPAPRAAQFPPSQQPPGPIIASTPHPPADNPIPRVVESDSRNAPHVRPPLPQYHPPVQERVVQPRFQTAYPASGYRDPYSELQPIVNQPERALRLPHLPNGGQPAQYLVNPPIPPKVSQPQIQTVYASRAGQNPFYGPQQNATAQPPVPPLPPNPCLPQNFQTQPVPWAAPATPPIRVPPPARRISFAPQHISHPSRPVLAPRVPEQPYIIPDGPRPQPPMVSLEQPTINPAMARRLDDIRAQRAPPPRETRNSMYSLPGAYPQGHPADDDWEMMTSVTHEDDIAGSSISHAHRPSVVSYHNPEMWYQAPPAHTNPVYDIFRQAWDRHSGAVV
jgi:hypothetical protein